MRWIMCANIGDGSGSDWRVVIVGWGGGSGIREIARNAELHETNLA